MHARWNRRKILKLEAEILELQSHVETRQSIATLSGEFVDFEITAQIDKILIGRGVDVDVDLSNQIGAGRIHRKHAVITVTDQVGWQKSSSVKMQLYRAFDDSL